MNAFTYVRERVALRLAIVFIVAGCTVPPPPPVPSTPRSFSCASFTESQWENFRFGVDSPDDVVAAAARLWGIERNQVHARMQLEGELVGDKVFDMRWWSDATVGSGGHYQAWFQSDQKLAKIRVEWGYPKPTLAQVIDCLGPPEHYIAFFENGPHGIYLSLALLYPDIGIVVRHFDIVWRYEPLKIHPNKRMGFFVVVPPGTAEQVVTEMYSYGNEDPYHVRSVCLLKPWPGSIEDMEIASEEEMIRCGVR